MQATIYLHARCPVCGYRNEGLQVGTAQPRMSGLCLQAGSIGWTPPTCTECGHPIGYELYDRGHLDQESTATWRAWRDRQKAKQKASPS
jgi:hypothetical protein